jgi:hypothetical protein
MFEFLSNGSTHIQHLVYCTSHVCPLGPLLSDSVWVIAGVVLIVSVILLLMSNCERSGGRD